MAKGNEHKYSKEKEIGRETKRHLARDDLSHIRNALNCNDFSSYFLLED